MERKRMRANGWSGFLGADSYLWRLIHNRQLGEPVCATCRRYGFLGVHETTWRSLRPGWRLSPQSFKHACGIACTILTRPIAPDQLRAACRDRHSRIESEFTEEFGAICPGHSKNPRFRPRRGDSACAIGRKLSHFDSQGVRIIQYKRASGSRMRCNRLECLADTYLCEVHANTLPDVKGLFILLKADLAQAIHQIVFGKVHCAVSQIRWQVTQDFLYATLLVCLSRRSIHFNDPGVLQQFTETIGTSIEAGAEDDYLRRTILYCPL